MKAWELLEVLVQQGFPADDEVELIGHCCGGDSVLSIGGKTILYQGEMDTQSTKGNLEPYKRKDGD